jgi:hypothetical protein
MIFAIISMIYAGTILFFVGTTALMLLAWARRRYADRSPNDLIYVAVSIILLADCRRFRQQLQPFPTGFA